MLLLDVIIDSAVSFHLLDLLETADGAFNRVKIRQSATKPAFGDIILATFFGRFFDGLLRLFLSADEQNLAALANRRMQKIASCLELVQRFAEVDDVDAVASVENERLHFRIPPFGLVPEVDAGIQQFLNANTNHSFPFVRSS